LFSSTRRHAYNPFARARLMSMNSVSCRPLDPWLFEFRGACPLYSDPVAAALILPELSVSLRTVFWAGVRIGVGLPTLCARDFLVYTASRDPPPSVQPSLKSRERVWFRSAPPAVPMSRKFPMERKKPRRLAGVYSYDA